MIATMEGEEEQKKLKCCTIYYKNGLNTILKYKTNKNCKERDLRCTSSNIILCVDPKETLQKE